MTTQKYNGWTNYETWVVNLWMDNDAGSDYWREQAEEALRNPGAYAEKYLTRKESATLALADSIKATHEEAQPEVTGVFADLINAAMSEVNWHEIAEHYVNDAAEETEGEQ